MEINTYPSIITLSVNGLNPPIQRHRVSEQIKKKKNTPSLYCLQETHFGLKDTSIWKVRGWRNIYHTNRRQKKAGVAIVTYTGQTRL